MTDSTEAQIRASLPEGQTLAEMARRLRQTWQDVRDELPPENVPTDLIATNEGILHLKGFHDSIVAAAGSPLADRLADLIDPDPGDAFDEVTA